MWSRPYNRGAVMSGRMIAARGLPPAACEPVPAGDGGGWSDPPPISGGALSTAEHLRFEVADAIAVASTAAGYLCALEEWLGQLPGRCSTATFTVPGVASAVGSLCDVDLELDRVAALLEALGGLAQEVDDSDPPVFDGEPDILRDRGTVLTHDVDDCVDPTLLPTRALVSALSRGARGDYAHEAAVDLLARFGCPSGFWLRRPVFLDNCVEAWLVMAPDDTTGAVEHRVDARIDGAALAALLDRDHVEGSAGELGILHLVAGLLGYPTARPLSDQLLGLDEDTTVLVLRAVAHVGGWHERGRTFVLATQDEASAPVDAASGARP